MRAVITGSAGFIGSHLAERLVAEGWWVTGVDSFSPFYATADKEANLAGLVGEPRFDLVRADVAHTPLHHLLADRPLVVHLAAQPGVLGSFGTGFNQYLQDNLLATQRLFEAAATAGCARVVYASSSSVYGDAEAYPCFEDSTPTRPRAPYGVTKQACEKLAEVYAGMGLPTVGMRFFTVYGPRQRPDMAIRRLCEAATGGPRFRLRGDGTQVRDFTHVDDAVDAVVRALTAQRPDPVLNIGGGEQASLLDVIRRLGQLTGAPVPVERHGVQIGDVRRTSGDTTKARDCLGWEPAVALRDGLRTELEWVQKRREAEVSVPDIALIAGRAS
ncbi:MAG TPA: NAD-dependent epimerase/dehydratase family protein [Mycobacteriales bacterium]|nr:NAD-dependent epimerase/dehydratase family protein [Mycobacteriales bacterium]